MSLDSQILAALIAALDDEALDLLADRLSTRLASGGGGAGRPAVYSVAKLAAEVGLSERVIRGAISRGELRAARRGRRYIIAAHAVEEWASPDTAPPPGRRARRNGTRSSVMAAAVADLDSSGYDDGGQHKAARRCVNTPGPATGG